jgi:urea carboxylase
LRIEDGTFSRREHQRFLTQHAAGIETFRTMREGAFAAERARWEAAGEFSRGHELLDAAAPSEAHDLGPLPEGAFVVEAPLHGCVARLRVGDGDRVAPGDTVALLEAMKTESAVPCPVGGTVLRVVCDVGDVVPAGAPLLVVVTDG